MRYAPFGKTGLNVSAITAGTWGIGGVGWGGAVKENSIAALRTMIDGGVNMIDTAPFYGVGSAEKVVGEAIKGYDRSKLYIVTKVGVTFPDGPDAMWKKNLSRASILREIDASLGNLDTGYIDLYVVHWPDIDTKAPPEESFTTLAELKKQGKIRHIGVSNFSIAEIEEARKYAEIEAYQPQHSMICRDNEDIMKWTCDHGIANMVYAPLGAGILTGHYRTLPKFEDNDWRYLFYPFFKEPVFGRVQKLLKTLDVIAKDHNAPVSQVVINWSARHPLVDTVLLGVRDTGHARENIAAMDWTLSDAETARINKTIAETVDAECAG
ncbi:MAG: aldo/keto reductase [Treponema sp.]|jgi:aryl-alcohol dehydrogenase-like predicted oxidoreductase|nr:aldo/keto reductase [Treponema sp.]